jgi:DNA polymerase-3 subunit delta'
MTTLFPWHAAQWQYLHDRKRLDQLPHALLLAGPVGVGKLAFAKQFAHALLCEMPQADHTACGRCRACIQIAADTHPDFALITPEEDSKAIKVDQIRQLIETISLASHHGGHRVTLVFPAEAMNTAAANSLLKTLEEPPAQNVMLLISHQPAVLPATIRSRCQRLDMPLPAPQQAIAWLQQQPSTAATPTEAALSAALRQAYGAPLLALEWLNSDCAQGHDQAFLEFVHIAQNATSPLTVAQRWLKADQGMPIQWLYSWLGDLIRLKSSPAASLINQDQQPVLHKLAQQVDLLDLFAILARVTEALRGQGTALNQQLIYETILMRWASISQRMKTGKGTL